MCGLCSYLELLELGRDEGGPIDLARWEGERKTVLAYLCFHSLLSVIARRGGIAIRSTRACTSVLANVNYILPAVSPSQQLPCPASPPPNFLLPFPPSDTFTSGLAGHYLLLVIPAHFLHCIPV